MKRPLQHARHQLFSRKQWRRQLIFWIGALVVGGASILFAWLAEWAERFFREGASLWWWLPFVTLPVGLALISWLTRRHFLNAQGSGIPQTIAALEATSLEAQRKLLSFRIAVGKILLTCFGLLCGASIGRQGPTVHVGASILFAMGKFAEFRHRDLDRGLILAGGAAGIAAAFHAPLAGIIYAIEELNRSFDARLNSTILVAVLIAGILSVVLLGEQSYFGKSDAAFALNGIGFAAIVVCGVIGGMLGGGFAILLVYSAKISAKQGWLQKHPVLLPVLCGLVIATIGFASGNTIFGTGYLETQNILAGEESGFLFPFFKIIATFAAFLSGIPGGIFAPAIATGAGVGADIATFFPQEMAAAIVLLGMTAYFAGMAQMPITAFVIVMEMTGNFGLLVPLMATAFIAYAVSRSFCPIPLFQALAQNFMPQSRKET